VPEGRRPVSGAARRWVVEPRRIAVLNSRGPSQAALGPTLSFGSAALGSTIVYLEFDPRWKSHGTVESAFLILEPAVPSSTASQDLEVAILTIDEPWSADRLTRARRPRLLPTNHRGLIRAEPRVPLRVDVTEAVRKLGRFPDHGLAMRSTESAGSGAAYHTGAGAGPPPRLEVYVVEPSRAPQ
jgi:hypothetical protein